jgi:hypothetical protein
MPRAKRSKNMNARMHNLAKRDNPGKSQAATNPFRKAPGKDDGKGTHFRSRSGIKIINMMREKPDL